MPIFDADSRQKLYSFLYQSFDSDNAGDMDSFARNFLHNGALWDTIGDHFPTASASAAKQVMMEAYAAWQKDQGLASVH